MRNKTRSKKPKKKPSPLTSLFFQDSTSPPISLPPSPCGAGGQGMGVAVSCHLARQTQYNVTASFPDKTRSRVGTKTELSVLLCFSVTDRTQVALVFLGTFSFPGLFRALAVNYGSLPVVFMNTKFI